jgi:predicted Zn-dependent protease
MMPRLLTIAHSRALFALGLLAVLLSASGCASISKGVADIGQAAGVITPQQADSIKKSGAAIDKTFEDITPEQEYYIGRAVGATIVSTYKVYDNDRATDYVNKLGQTIARFSDKPETFRGYHFLILDTDEVNAFAAPGGFIFLSRGMIKLCKSEDDLAAVIAHEVAHIQLKHAIGAIKSSRLTTALTQLTATTVSVLGPKELAQVTEAFEGSIGDITKTLNGGYARGQESDADRVAITILKRAGYRQHALIDVLDRMAKTVHETDAAGFGANHPPATTRIKALQPLVDDSATRPGNTARQSRFERATKSI